MMADFLSSCVLRRNMILLLAIIALLIISIQALIFGTTLQSRMFHLAKWNTSLSRACDSARFKYARHYKTVFPEHLD
jgi:hypothetical protein